VQECGPLRMMILCVAQAPGGLVHVGVWCRDEPEQ